MTLEWMAEPSMFQLSAIVSATKSPSAKLGREQLKPSVLVARFLVDCSAVNQTRSPTMMRQLSCTQCFFQALQSWQRRTLHNTRYGDYSLHPLLARVTGIQAVPRLCSHLTQALLVSTSRTMT